MALVTPLNQHPKCPICGIPGKNVEEDMGLTPFCSPRCKRLDLAKWLTEGYSLESMGGAFEEWDFSGEPN
tara:strand:- start:271 stop:480 length:210 start_codon:yes stop_codon:yes gene_type:complete